MANPLYSVPGLGGFLASQDRRRAIGQEDRQVQMEQIKLADLFNQMRNKQLTEEQSRSLGNTLGFIQAESAPQDIQRQTQSAVMQQGAPDDRSTMIKEMIKQPTVRTPDKIQMAEKITEWEASGIPENIAKAKTLRGLMERAVQPVGDKAPTTRVIQSGNQKITQEYVDGKWNNVAVGSEKTPAQLFKEDQDARKVAEREEKATKLKETSLIKAKIVINKANDALKKTGFFTTGLTGAVLSNIPGRDAYDLDKIIDTIKANVGFQELADMRASSPTGGALGQVAVKELEFLQATIASLDSGLSYEEKVKALNQIKTHYQNWVNAVEGKAAPDSVAPPSGGKADIHSEADKILGL